MGGKIHEIRTSDAEAVVKCHACHGSGVTVDHRLERPITGPCPVCQGTDASQPQPAHRIYYCEDISGGE